MILHISIIYDNQNEKVLISIYHIYYIILHISIIYHDQNQINHISIIYHDQNEKVLISSEELQSGRKGGCSLSQLACSTKAGGDNFYDAYDWVVISKIMNR